MKNAVLTFILFSLCATIFSGCTIWDVEELMEKSRPKSKDKDTAYTVKYNGNGSTGGTVPVDGKTYQSGAAVTVLGNTGNLVKTGYNFKGWSVTADGSGMSYEAGNKFTIKDNIVLYARWAVSLIEMVQIPSGTFTMGTESNGYEERPVRQVTISAFKIGKFEVTQEQYQEVMGENPSSFGSNPAAGELQGKRPVENVTWFDAIEFCNKLSAEEGLTPVYTITGRTPATGYPITSATVTAKWENNGYRLPTEAEWEYACRAGSNTNWSFGNTEAELVNYAWYSANANGMTHEVGKKTANTWGLYDMHGNVWEWCWDWYSSSYYGESGNTYNPMGPAAGTGRVLRGGSWNFSAEGTRSADRGSGSPGGRSYFIGFRVVRL